MILNIQTPPGPNNIKKLIQNHQTNPKNIFERKKLNDPITCNFGPIINLTNSSKCANFLALILVIHFLIFFARLLEL